MINILPYAQKKTIKHIRLIRIILVWVYGLIALALMATALFLPTLYTINSRYELADTQVRYLEQSGVVVKAVDVAELQKRIQQSKLKLALVVPTSPLVYIRRIVPYETSTITLTGYKMENTDKPIVQIYGIAKNRESLQDFIARLQADPTVLIIDSPIANFVKSTQNDFTISINFKPV